MIQLTSKSVRKSDATLGSFRKDRPDTSKGRKVSNRKDKIIFIQTNALLGIPNSKTRLIEASKLTSPTFLSSASNVGGHIPLSRTRCSKLIVMKEQKRVTKQPIVYDYVVVDFSEFCVASSVRLYRDLRKLPLGLVL